MPIQKAGFKHVRQTKRQTAQNRAVKERLKAIIKETRTALSLKDKTKAADALKRAVKKLDKAAQNKVIKKNRAARLKSRLTKGLNKLT
ncbi:MAG: 30S ribosomal protein S20 [Patescibacteria group bacterium]